MNKNKQKSTKTKNKLKKAFLQLYKSKKIEKITIKNITDKAGFNRGTFYLYYKDVYDIHEQIKQEILTQAETKIDNINIRDKTIPLSTILEKLIKFYKQKNNIIIPLIANDPNFQESIKKIIKSKIINNPTKKTDYLIEYHLSAIIGIANYYLKNQSLNQDELFNLISEVSTKGVLTILREK